MLRSCAHRETGMLPDTVRHCCGRDARGGGDRRTRAGADRAQLRRHLDRGVGQPEEELGAVPAGDGEGDRLQGQRLLRHRLCRRDRGDALQQGAGRLVRQQVRHGSGRPCRAARCSPRSSRSDGSIGYYSHIIVHTRQPLHQARGHPASATSRSTSASATRTRPRASWCRPSYIFAANEHRSEVLLQDRAQRQPPGQRHGGRQQAGRRRHQQQRGSAARGR